MKPAEPISLPAPESPPAAPRAATGWRTWGRVCRDLVFPPVCLACGGLCEDGPLRHVCARCAPLIVRVREPFCFTCGHPFFGVVAGERQCPHCEGLHPVYREARTVTLFKGPARALVLELKYHQGTYAVEDLRTLIAASPAVLDYVRDAVLVPVPLHPRKLRERGYNQSRLIAEAFAQSAGGTTAVQELLERTLDGESQTAYDRQTRRKRMKNAFAPRNGAVITARQRYILVDDVFTTGSTLNACAFALRHAGGLNLDVVTFAHG